METTKTCPWCSEPIPDGTVACPKCGAAVEGQAAAGIPGVTEVDPSAQMTRDEGLVPDGIDPMSWMQAGHGGPEDEDAYDHPTPEVEAEIRRMELEAEIANAGGMVMSATDDVSRDAPMPSDEAIAALKAGLIDPHEDELTERAQGLEVDEEESNR
jgi:hypothetical protein